MNKTDKNKAIKKTITAINAIIVLFGLMDKN